MLKLINSIRRWLRRDAPEAVPEPEAIPGPEAVNVAMIMRQLEATHTIELSCDEILSLMDECAEAALRGQDISALMPLFQRHMDMCADCREEFEGLLRILRAEHA
jgi:hypothetical protein